MFVRSQCAQVGETEWLSPAHHWNILNNELYFFYDSEFAEIPRVFNVSVQ